MSLTRKMLEAMGIEAGKIDTIVEAHRETVDPIMRERDELKAKLDSIDTSKDWKAEFEKEHSDFEAYKAEQGKRDNSRAKASAYRELLKSTGMTDSRVEAVMRVSDIDGIELDKDGKAKNADKLLESIKAEWSEFIPAVKVEGMTVATPPHSMGAPKMTKDEIFAIRDAGERQRAIAANLDLFGG